MVVTIREASRKVIITIIIITIIIIMRSILRAVINCVGILPDVERGVGRSKGRCRMSRKFYIERTGSKILTQEYS